MKRVEPLRKILIQTRSHWDRIETRPAVRSAFAKALQCRTLELGAEVFASGDEEQVFYHTCKSRPCSSCGYRATLQWQRERWAALPDVPYKGITFTMPDLLWPFFRDNRRLATALPALAATVLETQMSARHGLRVGLMAVLHTFNGKLEFNSHVHSMVSAGGMHLSTGSWTSSVYYDGDRLMKLWRDAVIKLFRAALREGLLKTEMSFDQMEV